MSVPRVSVIIPVRNNAPGLRRCLEALARQTLPASDFEAVVVDNGSSDDPASAAAGFPFVRLERELKAGPSAARNRGLVAARGGIVAFTDADCEPLPNWLEKGLASLPDGGCLAGAVAVAPADPASPTALELFDMAYAFDQRLSVERWHFGATANLFVSRAAVVAIGGFDENVAYYFEEVDFGRRLWKAGCPMVFGPEAVVIHPARRDWESFRLRQSRTVRAAYADGDPSVRRLVSDLWHDWPSLRVIGRSVVHPVAGGGKRGLGLAAVTAAARLIRARIRINQFLEQRGGREP